MHFSHHKKKQLREEQLARCKHPALAHVIDENIATIAKMREQAEKDKSWQDRCADKITQFSGSMLFFYLHAIWFGAWIGVNLGFFGLPPFDPFPFGLLTMIVSLEAIFLSTFVLISQNRQAEVADQRADLDLQINLLAEYEITRLLMLVDAMSKKIGVQCDDPELSELEQKVEPDALLQELEKNNHKPHSKHAKHA
jgi:uncharacterized membrane protein